MGATVSELQDRITSSEFAEWKAFYEIDPFGTLRGDLQAGQVATMTASLGGHSDLTPFDFVLTENTHKEPVLSNKAAGPGPSAETAEILASLNAKRVEKN